MQYIDTIVHSLQRPLKLPQVQYIQKVQQKPHFMRWTQPMNRETDISAKHVKKKKKRGKEKPVLVVSRTRCCKLHDQGARAPSANQRGLKRSRDRIARVVELPAQPCKRHNSTRRTIAADRSATACTATDTAKQVTISGMRLFSRVRGRDENPHFMRWTQHMNRETDISAKHVKKKKKRGKEKPVLIVSRTRCCKLHDQGARAPSANQRSRSGTLPRSGVGGARRGIQEVVNFHKVTLEESETEPQPKSQW